MTGLQQASLQPNCTSAGVSHRGLCGRPPGFRCYLLQCGALRGQPWQQQPEGEHQQYPGVARLGDGRGEMSLCVSHKSRGEVVPPRKAVPGVHVGIMGSMVQRIIWKQQEHVSTDQEAGLEDAC